MSELFISTPGVELLRLEREHIGGIIQLMNKEGWYYYDDHELERYLNLGQDCFTLIKDECVVGSIFTTNYGNQAWIGNVVVAEECRGMGLAGEMIRAITDYLREEKKIFTFRLGSVPLAIGLYKKAGFHPESFTTAQQAELPMEITDEEIDLGGEIKLEVITRDDLRSVAELDEQFFRSNRLQFLENVYNDSIKDCCLCLKDQGRVVGYLMLRRRKTSKAEGGFVEGPDYVYRLGPASVLTEYGVNGFKALFQEAMRGVNENVRQAGGTARIYVVFPKNADKAEIFNDTRVLAEAMGMDADAGLDKVFDEHEHIFGAPHSVKNAEQWKYMESLGFQQEYFEQVMSCTPRETRADTEGIYASATPGDKA
jgi:predicted N-acetyltransferase YhbS